MSNGPNCTEEAAALAAALELLVVLCTAEDSARATLDAASLAKDAQDTVVQDRLNELTACLDEQGSASPAIATMVDRLLVKRAVGQQSRLKVTARLRQAMQKRGGR